MNIYGAFLLIGPEIEPQVGLLTQNAKARLDDALAVASKHEKDSSRHAAYRNAFGVHAHFAIPCWVPEAMTSIATQYTGKDQERVRGMAACIALGQPYGPPEPGELRGGDDGGRRAPIDPVKPKPRKPSGGNTATTATELLFGNTKRASRERSAEREAMRIESLQR